jgi:hypothetical protein
VSQCLRVLINSMTNLKPIGHIVRLQIQRSTLSLGEKPNRYFDPAALLSIQAMQITTRGAVALLPDGGTHLDYHHADYPNGRNVEMNDLSFNFTGHYDLIREKFGAQEHLYDGCGGENILIELRERVPVETLAGGLAVQLTGGGVAWLKNVVVALPCQPFSKYVSRRTEAPIIKDTLQFLDNGTRGFYCVFEDEQPVTIQLGDELFISEQ